MRRLVSLLVLACLAGGCARTSHDTASVPGSCGDRPSIEGLCVGVPPTDVCADDRCVDGVTCARVLDATPSSMPAAAAGDCIALAAGNYGDLSLEGGVSLLGRNARDVKLGRVTFAFAARATSLVRGVAAQSVFAQGSAHGALLLDHVLVDGASTPTVIGVEVEDGDLLVNESTLANGGGAGVLVACHAECPPGERPRMTLRQAWIHDAHRIGAWAFGVDADLRDVVIQDTRPQNFLFGRGFEASNRATVQAAFVRIENSGDVQLSVFGSAGTFGPGIELRGSGRGVHLGSIPEGGAVLDGFTIDGAQGIGVGIDASSLAVVLRNGTIHGTQMVRMPSAVGGMENVGDGVSWADGAQASIEPTVVIGKSARRAATIRDTARGTFAASLGDGDQSGGILVHGPGDPSMHPDLTIAAGIPVEYAPTSAGPASPSPAPKP